MLLALACGVAIMLAGAVFLFQLSGQDELADPAAIGEAVTVGDMTIVVDDVQETSGVLDVTVTIGGVDDVDGSAPFRLIASGRPVIADPERPAACGATTIDPVVCHVYFDVGVADGASRVLFYERGDDQARWVLG